MKSLPCNQSSWTRLQNRKFRSHQTYNRVRFILKRERRHCPEYWKRTRNCLWMRITPWILSHWEKKDLVKTENKTQLIAIFDHCCWILLATLSSTLVRLSSIIPTTRWNVSGSRLSTTNWAWSFPFSLKAEGHLLMISCTMCPISWGERCFSFS